MTGAFTICTASYLPQAIAWAGSLRQQAPEWRIFLGLVDDLTDAVRGAIPEWVRVLPAADLGLAQLDELARRYAIVELCTALKPSYFRHLWAAYPEIHQLHYFDPDILVFAPPDPLAVGLGEHAIQLTPHHFTPLPLDGQFPDETLALNHGVYNLGYLGLRRGSVADQLLDWWADRMRHHCRIDLRQGLFVDQLWFNFVPLYFPRVTILRHPGANVAFWNLHERQLHPDGSLTFEGARHPLLFFHFSGYSPQLPDRLTRVATRSDVNNLPAIHALLGHYGRALHEHGYVRWRGLESTYARLHREARAATARAFARQHPGRFLIRQAKDLLRRAGRRFG